MARPRTSGYDGNRWPKLRRRQVVQNIVAANLQTPKDIASKSGETHVRDHHTNSHADRRDISVPGQNMYIFFIEDTLGGLLSHAISRRADFKL